MIVLSSYPIYGCVQDTIIILLCYAVIETAGLSAVTVWLPIANCG